MPNTLILKRSSVANAVPTVANLTEGELALNYTDGNLFYKTAANTISVIASNKFLSVTGNVTGGNIITGGLVSATGNIIGNRVAVGNGTAAAPSLLFINDVASDTGLYLVSDGNIGVSTNGTLRATFLDTGFSVVGNVTGGNLITGGLVSATGNVTGNYILGNGSQLTGINTNVTVGGSNTNVQFNDNGVLGGNGNLTFNKTTGTLSATSIVFPDSAGDTVGFTAPANVTSPVTWKLPPADGTIYGNVLATDTTGNLMWRGFSSTVFVYTRTSTVAVSAINGYVNILGRTGNIYVSIT
jgi:hypothetical protein